MRLRGDLSGLGSPLAATLVVSRPVGVLPGAEDQGRTQAPLAKAGHAIEHLQGRVVCLHGHHQAGRAVGGLRGLSAVGQGVCRFPVPKNTCQSEPTVRSFAVVILGCPVLPKAGWAQTPAHESASAGLPMSCAINPLWCTKSLSSGLAVLFERESESGHEPATLRGPQQGGGAGAASVETHRRRAVRGRHQARAGKTGAHRGERQSEHRFRC